MTAIRMGIVGCGNMAAAHAAGYYALKDRMTVTATCDLNRERAARVAQLYGARHVFQSYRDMIEHVDAVLIALPHDLHYEAGMTFLEAGKHVLIEKPIANTEQECMDLLYAAERRDKVLMTAYSVRYNPMILFLKQLLEQKTYGELFQLSIFTEQYTEYSELHWARSAARLGGGQLFSHGCHYIDLLLWYMGKPVKGTHLGTNLGTPWMEREGTSNVTIQFESGAIGMHFGTWGARGSRLRYSIHAHCTGGMLELDLTNRKLYAHIDHREELSGIPGSPCVLLMEAEDKGKFLYHETNHFLDCILHGQNPQTDAAGSLQGLRVIWRLYEAELDKRIADLRGLGLDEDWSRVPIRHFGS
ncbi:MAG: oxidoreductase domain protein [Paenibacillus sp.]|nr:oxidoreductase domain protein [Paenibacillus sp.]